MERKIYYLVDCYKALDLHLGLNSTKVTNLNQTNDSQHERHISFIHLHKQLPVTATPVRTTITFTTTLVRAAITKFLNSTSESQGNKIELTSGTWVRELLSVHAINQLF